MLHFMVQIYSELSTSSIQRLEIFAPLAQHFMMKSLQNLNQYHAIENESIKRDQFCRGRSDFSRLFKKQEHHAERHLLSEIITAIHEARYQVGPHT